MSDDFPDDKDRRPYAYPPAIKKADIAHEYTKDKFEQQQVPKAPVRAIKIKGDALRNALRNGNPLDWNDIYERFVDLWQEARMVIWRAKHSRKGFKTYDEVKGKDVQTYLADDKLVLAGIDSTRAILDSLIKVRREAGNEATGIPRWAIERIERALRNHPEALNELLKDLAAESEKSVEQ